MTSKKNTSQPFQSIERAPGGELRFRQNAIVAALLDHGERTGLDLNKIAVMQFTRADRVQLAQLIGYTLDGFGELGYVTDEDVERARAMARATLLEPSQGCHSSAKPCRKCTAYPRIVVDRTSREISVKIHCFSYPPCLARMVEARSLIDSNLLTSVMEAAITRWNDEVDQPSNTNEET